MIAATDKTILRRIARQKRNSLNSVQQNLHAQRLCKRFRQLLRNQQCLAHALKIGVYLANDAEMSLAPVIRFLWNKGWCCYLPVLSKTTPGTLRFVRYHYHQSLRMNRFGIAEPILTRHKETSLQTLDILLMPLVAFDRQGNRLGMGGGFYDKTLQNHFSCASNRINGRKKNCCHQRIRRHFTWLALSQGPVLIGVAHHAQKVSWIKTQDWDIRPFIIITESYEV